MSQTPVIWGLMDRAAGHRAQTLGVCDALGHEFTELQLTYGPLAKLPNALLGARCWGLDSDAKQRLTAKLASAPPDLVVACGRRTAPVARWIKQQTGARLVQLMHPDAPLHAFDLVCIPSHDQPAPAANVLVTIGAAHAWSAKKLADARAAWAARLRSDDRPLVAVLLGGATRKRGFSAEAASDMGHRVRALADSMEATIFATTSPRTPDDARVAFTRALGQPATVHVAGAGGDNPYGGLLACGDVIVTSGDSVSMCCEAMAAGVPVYVYAPDTLLGEKHRRFVGELVAGGFAQNLSDAAQCIDQKPLYVATQIADEVVRRGLIKAR